MEMALVIGNTMELTHEQWLELRRTGIGGSDAAAAAGVSDYRSRITLWADKLGVAPEREQSEAMEWGLRHEDTLFRAFCDKHPELKVTRSTSTLQHPTVPFMLANVDGVIEDSLGHKGILELKTAGHWMAKKWQGGEVPTDYLWQVVHYMAVLGPEYRYAIVPVLIGGNHYEERIVYRDEAQIEWLIAKEQEFWGYVQREEMPPVDDSESTADTFAALWASSSPSVCRLPDDAIQWIAQRETAIEAQKEAERLRNEAENHLKALLNEYEGGTVGRYAVKWSNVKQERIDSKRLRLEAPDVAKKYIKDIEYRRFTVSEVK